MSTKLKPAFDKNNLCIVFASDTNYVPYMGVSIKSIIDNADNNYNYDILVFDDGITDYQKKLISSMLPDNFSIRYIDVKSLLNDFDTSFLIAGGIWSIATYYRIFIPQILQDYKKVLYLDCDILVKDSLVDLFNTNLKGYMGGCIIDSVKYVQSQNRIKDRSKLGISDYKKYFNAGVILFNLQEIDAVSFKKDFFHTLKTKELPFLDQDILNILMKDKYKTIDISYNYQYHILNEHPELRNIAELAKAEQNPKIIHYTTGIKPWNTPAAPLANYWWFVARNTPFYEEIIYNNTRMTNSYLHTIIYRNRYFIRYGIIKMLSILSFGKLHRKFKKMRKDLQPKIRAIKRFCRNK